MCGVGIFISMHMCAIHRVYTFCGVMSCLYVQRVFLSDVSSATHFLVDDFKFYMKRLFSCISRIVGIASMHDIAVFYRRACHFRSFVACFR